MHAEFFGPISRKYAEIRGDGGGFLSIARLWWAHQDLNLESADYESPPALSGIRENSRFSTIPDNAPVWAVRFGDGRLRAIGHDIGHVY